MSKKLIDELKAKGLQNIASLLEGETVPPEDDEAEYDEKGEKKEKKEEKACKESFDTFVSDLQLTEENVEQLRSVFESAVAERVAAEVSHLEDAMESRLALMESEQDKTVERYLDFVVESWVKEHEAPLVNASKVAIAESALAVMRAMIQDHSLLNESDEVVDLVEAAKEETQQVRSELAEALDLLESARTEAFAVKVQTVIDQLSEGMTETDKERFFALVGEVDLELKEGIEVATEKVKSIKESFVATEKKADSASTEIVLESNVEEVPEQITEGGQPKVDERMARYLSAVKRGARSR